MQLNKFDCTSPGVPDSPFVTCDVWVASLGIQYYGEVPACSASYGYVQVTNTHLGLQIVG